MREPCPGAEFFPKRRDSFGYLFCEQPRPYSGLSLLNPAKEDQWRYKRVVGIPVGLFVAALAAALILGFAAAAGLAYWSRKPSAPPVVVETTSIHPNAAPGGPAVPNPPDAQGDPQPQESARPTDEPRPPVAPHPRHKVTYPRPEDKLANLIKNNEVAPGKATPGRPFTYQLPQVEGAQVELAKPAPAAEMTLSPEGLLTWTPQLDLRARTYVVKLRIKPGRAIRTIKILVDEKPTPPRPADKLACLVNEPDGKLENALALPGHIAGWVMLSDGVRLIVALPDQNQLVYIDTVANKELKRASCPSSLASWPCSKSVYSSPRERNKRGMTYTSSTSTPPRRRRRLPCPVLG